VITHNTPLRSIVNSSGNATVVWALLTRHITHIEDFKDNKEYITLAVYDNDGKRVYYPGELIHKLSSILLTQYRVEVTLKIQAVTTHCNHLGRKFFVETKVVEYLEVNNIS